MPRKSWQEMNKEELCKYYSPSMWNPSLSSETVIQQHVKKIEKDSRKSYESVPCERNIHYGESEREVVDIFGEATLPKDSPICCFIHGGYWQQMSHNQYALQASEWYKDGVVFCLLEYQLAPLVGISEIVEQVGKAVRFLIDRFKTRGSSGLYLAGHSAGGQLVAEILADNELLATNFIKGAVFASMVADLEPLVYTGDNEALKLTVEEARRLSPCHKVQKIGENCATHNIPVAVMVGEFDSPEFKRQSCEFHEALRRSGLRHVSLKIAEKLDHFDIVWEVRSNMMDIILISLLSDSE